MWTLLLLFLVAVSAGCHPECHWACDDPVCQAVCQAICDTPVCTFFNSSSCSSYQPNCRVQCPADMCESDACPQCETVCQPPPNECSDGTILCEPTACAWTCRKPSNCPYPRCELQCEQPACQAAAGTKEQTRWLLVLGLLLMGIAIV